MTLKEKPRRSLICQEPPIEAVFSHPNMGEAKVDLCMYGKTRPDTGELVHKPLTFKGTKDVCVEIERVCDKSHKHSQVQGAIAADKNGW